VAAPSFLASLATPYNWVYKAEILAKDVRWYRRTSWEPALRVWSSTSGLALGRQEEHNYFFWDKGKP